MNIKFLDVSFPMHFEYEERLPIEKKDEKFEIFQELKMYFYKNNKFPSCYNLNTKSEFILGENDKHLIMFSEKQLNILFKVWGETGYRVRKLTPRESFRLMGFSDKAYDAARYYTDTEKDELDKLNKKYSKEALEQVEINHKYEGYIIKAKKEAEKMIKLGKKQIPEDIDYEKVDNLATEARQKLEKIRPRTIDQATRISGVNPSDIAILMVYLKRFYNE